MDVAKTVATINDFQNAADKVRPFMLLVQKADELWNELKDIDPGVLQALVSERDQLTKQVAYLTDQKNTITGQLNAVASEFNTKQNQLDSDYAAMKADLEKKHQAQVADMKAEITALLEQANAAKTESENQLGELASQRSRLETQIGQLKSQANAMLHA